MQLLDTIQEFDERILRSMNLAGGNEVLDALMVFFTLLGISYVMVFVSVPMWLRGKKELAFDTILLVILASFITEVLKLLIDRPRPIYEISGVNTILSASGPSFPSAHASRAFAVACLLLLRHCRRVGAVALVLASLIAISRVYLGVHWPTDILAGSLLGALAAYAINRAANESVAYRSIRKRIIRIVSREGA